MRSIPILTLLGLMAACGRSDGPKGDHSSAPPSRPTATRDHKTPAAKPVPVSPPTGTPRYQQSLDTWRGVVADLKQRFAAAAGEGGKAPSKEEVAQAVHGIGLILGAVRRATEQEARRDLEHAHALLVQEQSKLLSDRDVDMKEVAELTGMLQRVRKGLQPVPAGHTEAELQDRRSDLLEKVRKLDERNEKVRAELRAQEAELKEKTIEPKEPTLLANLRDSFEKLLEEAKALEKGR